MIDFNRDYSSLNNAKSRFEPVPEGNYVATIESLTLAESKQGFPMVKARFSVSAPADYSGKYIYVNLVVLRNGDESDANRVRQCNEFLTKLGCGGISLTTISEYGAQISAIAQECVCGQYTYTLNVRYVGKNKFQAVDIVDGPVTSPF